jgi:molybdopterin converting factor small subunit
MSVTLEVSPIFGRYTDNQVMLQAEGKTIGECLNDVGRKFPELKKMIIDRDGNLAPSFDVFVNGESAYPQMMSRPVKDGDKLHLIMLITGG